MTTVSIADQLKVLLELQELDSKIYRLKQELSEKPAATALLKANQEQASHAVQTAETDYKVFEVKRNQMEMDLSKKESEIQKLQGQLFQVKTNKEYSALQKEIEGFKADKSVLEEEVLKLLEDVDQAKERLAGLRETLKTKQTALAEESARLEEEAKKIRISIEQFQAGRSQLIPKVDPQILARYERILENKNGRAMVPVKSNACGGCFMLLPPQLINEVHLASRLVTCESCARILYIEPDN